jgi:hypothetical protein
MDHIVLEKNRGRRGPFAELSMDKEPRLGHQQRQSLLPIVLEKNRESRGPFAVAQSQNILSIQIAARLAHSRQRQSLLFIVLLEENLESRGPFALAR